VSARYVVAIDQGTTSTRCIVFDQLGRFVSVAQREHRQWFPEPGWVEHDALEIWANVQRVVPAALAKAGIGPDDVAALGIANQRETAVLWDRRTGRPVARAVTWQDTRVAPLLPELARRDPGQSFRVRCGLPLSTYATAPRLTWLMRSSPEVRRRAAAGELLFGTMETWLVWQLTGGPDGGVHVTDVTNASRTMLMDLRTLDWDDELCDAFEVPRVMLPEVRPSAAVHGRATQVLPGVVIGAAIGDQQAALFGQACFAPGEAKCTYGTGAFLLLNTGSEPVASTHGLATTVAYQVGDEPAVFALEGSIAMTGSLVQWFRDGLALVRTAPEIETLARTVDDNGGCFIVPAFSGLFAPHWRPEARGVITGLTSYVTRGHLARAVLEATAWQTVDVVDAMNADAGVSLTALRVDGGMTSNMLLMQTISDLLDVPVERPMVHETVSLGAAYAAGLTVGLWPDLAVLRRNWHCGARWAPDMAPDQRERQRGGWRAALAQTFASGEVSATAPRPRAP
jgi:glycerol kinase